MSGSGGRPKTRARSALRAAVAVADGSGQVRTEAVAAELGVCPRSARRGLSALAGLGLARQTGVGVWMVTGATTGAAVPSGRTETTEDEGPKPTDKTTRARLGGLERALREVQQQRDDAQARLRAKEGGASKGVAGAMLADLRHLSGCDNGGCERCDAIRSRVSARHPQYVPAGDVADALERGAAAQQSAVVVLKALAATGPGARDQLRRAAQALSLAVAGDTVAALAVVQTLEP